MTAVSLTFNGIQLNPINHNSQIWLTSSELASSLGYADEGGVRKIYNRYKDEFSASMSTILPATQIDPLGESSGLQREMRVFSLRGCPAWQKVIGVNAREKKADTEKTKNGERK